MEMRPPSNPPATSTRNPCEGGVGARGHRLDGGALFSALPIPHITGHGYLEDHTMWLTTLAFWLPLGIILWLSVHALSNFWYTVCYTHAGVLGSVLSALGFG